MTLLNEILQFLTLQMDNLGFDNPQIEVNDNPHHEVNFQEAQVGSWRRNRLVKLANGKWARTGRLVRVIYNYM